MNRQTDSSPQRAGIAEWTDPAGLRHAAAVSVWGRWLILAVALVLMAYRPDYTLAIQVSYSLLALLAMSYNAYVHFLVRTGRNVRWQSLLVLSAMDVVLITGGTAVGGELGTLCFLLYYPALGMFAAVFSSFRISFAWVTMTAVLYGVVTLTTGEGLDVAAKEEKVLIARITAMYGVVVVVTLIAGFERVRRLEAVERVREQERERQLQMERLQLSQIIHDTIAQSAYVLRLGIESAIAAEDPSNREQVARLRAMHELSRSTMWELRHPIDIDLIFRGRELGTVLEAHAATFTNITSIPTEVVCSGEEPPLSTVTRGLLFAIAHNALANALRHASASKVTITLDFKDNALRMSISDDGIGLPSDYAEHGRGFTSMETDAEQMGGTLEVSSGQSGRGTAVTCVVPYEEDPDAS